MRFTASLFFALVVLITAVYRVFPPTLESPTTSSPAVMVTAVPTALPKMVELHVFVTRDSLTLYVPEAVSLSGFEWHYVVDGIAQPELLTDSFDALGLTNNMASANDCYIYRLEGTSPALARSCKGNVIRVDRAPADVFWYDRSKSDRRTLAIYRNNTLLGICSGDDCVVHWDSAIPISNVKIGLALTRICAGVSAGQAQKKIADGIGLISWNTLDNAISNSEEAKRLAQQNDYAALIWWKADNYGRMMMHIEIAHPSPVREILNPERLSIFDPGCSSKHASQVASAVIRYILTLFDYGQIAGDLAALEKDASTESISGEIPELNSLKLLEGNALLLTNQYNVDTYDAAISAYDGALQTQVDWALAYHNRGIARLEKGYWIYLIDNSAPSVRFDTITQIKNDAVIDFSQAIQYAPDDDVRANAYLDRGRTYFMIGTLADGFTDYDDSLRDCKEVENFGVTNPSMQSLGITCHAAALVLKCQDSIDLHVDINCGMSQEIVTALKLLNRAAALTPDLADIEKVRGDALVLVYSVLMCNPNSASNSLVRRVSKILEAEIIDSYSTFWTQANDTTIKLHSRQFHIDYAGSFDLSPDQLYCPL